MQTRDAHESIDLFGIPGDLRISRTIVLPAFESNDPSEGARKHLLAIVDRDHVLHTIFAESGPPARHTISERRTGSLRRLSFAEDSSLPRRPALLFVRWTKRRLCIFRISISPSRSAASRSDRRRWTAAGNR